MLTTSNPPHLDPRPHPTLARRSADRSRYVFEHLWFEHTRTDWEELTRPLLGKKLRVLEIGSFEGASTTWMLDNLMDHPQSSLTAVDTFGGGIDINDDGPNGFNLGTLEQRFWNNINLSSQKEKLRLMKMTSAEALVDLRKDRAEFDFIYIDGSHVAIDVLQDAVMSWSMLSEYGTMVFDDFHWRLFQHEAHCPQIAIVSFLRCAAPKLRAFQRKTQIWVQKIPEHIKPIPV